MQKALVWVIQKFPKGSIWQTRYICFPLTIIAGTYFLSHSSLIWYERIFWYVLGALTWTLLEYILHRWLLHYQPTSLAGKALLDRLHIHHHHVPQDESVVCLPIHLTAPIWTMIVLLLWGLGGGQDASLIATSGLALMMVLYDITHYSTHYMEPTNGLLRALKRNHMHHHFVKPNTRFGVTSSLWDYVFGTRN